MKQLFLIFCPCIALLWACPPRCEDTASINNGKLSAQDLLFVPYQNGDSLILQHSGGYKIVFGVKRETTKINDNYCAECCDEIIYESNTSTLISDYPTFSIVATIDNIDTIFTHLIVSIGKYSFYFPTDTLIGKPSDMVIENKAYTSVYSLKSDYGSAYDTDSIYADSLYYSYEKGIIQIVMSNKEKFSIYE